MKPMWMAIAVLALAVGIGEAADFTIRPGKDNKVVFVSTAPVENFEGKTSQMEGHFTVDPAAVGDSINLHVEVDLASLDTGIAKRNKHMRENHLETSKYPKAVFDGASVRGPAGAKLEPGKATMFDVEGTFTLHGVSRRIRINVEATYASNAKGNRITFRTNFPVVLGDYSISRPQFLFLKLSEKQDVRVSGVAIATP